MSRERIFKIVKSNVPSWKDIDFTPEELILTPFKSLTNTIVSAELPKAESEPRKVLVRIFADTSKIINQRKERVIFTEIANQKMGPYMLAESDHYRVEEFLDSRMLTNFELRNRLIIKSFAEKMCDFHYNKALDNQLKEVEKKNKPFIVKILDEWLQVFKDEYGMYCSMTTLPENKKVLEEMKFLLTPQFIEEFTRMLPCSNKELVVAHNDIHEGNILQLNKDRTKLTIIDYEYCNYNYRAFDLSLYVTESALDYTYPDCPFLKLYEENRMDGDEVMYLCDCYLKQYFSKYYQGTETYEQYRNKELPILIDEVMRLEPLNNVMWSMWAITTIHWNEFSKVKEKDLWNYGFAKVKFDVFNKLKKQFLLK